ncbi:MAG: hypothetical protein OSB62_00160 [Alphaproteobacteria bacterium]|nr:hypothetical protein [Alphaproteobacteria bacterium]
MVSGSLFKYQSAFEALDENSQQEILGYCIVKARLESSIHDYTSDCALKAYKRKKIREVMGFLEKLGCVDYVAKKLS